MAGPALALRMPSGFNRVESIDAQVHESTSTAMGATVAPAELAFVLVAAGLVCIVFRLASPAMGWKAVVLGSLFLLLGAASLASLPPRAAGLLMLALAVASLGMEVLVLPGFGLHAVGGGVSLILAGVYLTEDVPGVHPAVAVPIAVAVAGLTYFAGRRSWRCIRHRPLDSSTMLVGRGTVVLTATGSSGRGVVSGHVWELRTEHGELRPGETVCVTQLVGDYLVVEPAPGLDLW